LIIINFNGFIFFEGGTAAPEYSAIPRLGIQAALWGTAIVSIILNDCMMVSNDSEDESYSYWPTEV
jgi:hypothetical protein